MSALNLDTYSLSLITAKEDILSDRTSTDWAVFTYEKKWSLKLLDSGVGGLQELTKKLNKKLVQYGLCRMSDPNTGVRRVILIHWIGENVDTFQGEVAAQHLPSIRKFFKEANVLLAAQKVEDITQEMVAQALSRVPQPTRSFQKPQIPRSHEVVGTKYMKTNPAVEMKISKRQAFWERSEREEERRKETERLRLQEERIVLERARIERERLEEEERERRIQEKERLVDEQRKEQARLEAERRKLEKERWAQQHKEYEEELKGRFKRSQSIEMAAEAAALVSSRSLHPRDFFRQQERSVSSSFSPPSTPSSPSKSSSGFFNRTTLRYQRSMTESILTPTNRSPTFFQGFQKRDSFSSPSASSPQTCSPAFIFSKSPLPGTAQKVDSLPSFIPPPITTTRMTPTQVKGILPPPHIPPRTDSEDLPFRAEYVTVSPAEHNAATLNTKAQARAQHQDLHNGDNLARSGGLYRAALVSIDSPSTCHAEVKDLPNKETKSPFNVTDVKASVPVSTPVTEVAFTCSAPVSESKILDGPQNTETILPIPPSALGSTQPATSAVDVNTLTKTAQVSASDALLTQEGINKTTNIKFHSETILSTNSASSYEPKMVPATTSLVSLLAPIPYTPYRTQRSDCSTLRSSSNASLSGNAPHPPLETPPLVTLSCQSPEASPSSAVSASKMSSESKYPLPGEFIQDPSTRTSSIPVSGHPLIDGDLEYQMNIPETTLNLSVFAPVTYECSLKPQRSSTQTEVPLIDSVPDFLPASASQLLYDSTSSQHSYDQVDVAESLLGSMVLPVKSSCDLQTDIPPPPPQSSSASSGLLTSSSPESEPNSNQTEGSHINISDYLLPQWSPVSPLIPTELQPCNVKADNQPVDFSPDVLAFCIEGSTESQLDYKISDITSLEQSPVSPACGCSAEFQLNNIQANILLPDSSSLIIPIEISVECQPNTIQTDNLLPELSLISSSIPAESSAVLQLNNIQADIPLVELSHEPPFITTEGPLNVQADIPLIDSSSEPSCTTKRSSRPQLNSSQADISLLEPSHELSSITTEGCFGPQINIQTNIPLTESLSEPSYTSTEGSSGPQLSNIQTIIPLIEPSSKSPPTTTESSSQLNNIRVDIPLVEESHEPPSITTKVSSSQVNVQADIPLMESPSELSCTTTKSSSGLQLDNIQADITLLEPSNEAPAITTECCFGPQINIQTNIPLTESSSESSCTSTEGSSGPQLSNIQTIIPLIEPSFKPPSTTTESSSQLNNIRVDIPLVESSHEPPSITTKGSSGQVNVQVDIVLMESSEPSCTSTEESSAPQLNNILHAVIPLIESSFAPQSTTTKGSSQPNNIGVDIPKVELSHEPTFITTEGFSDQLNVKPDILLMEFPFEPSCTTTKGSSRLQLNNMQADISLVEPSHELPSITTEGCYGPQINIQTDIPLTESSPEPSCTSTEGSSGPQLSNIQTIIPFIEPSSAPSSTTTKKSSQHNKIRVDIPLVESSHEPSSMTTKGSSGQVNVQADITLMESPSEPSCATTKSSSGLQLDNIQADIPLVEPSNEAPSITTGGSSQLNFPADIPFTEPLSGSSSPLPESLIELQSTKIPTDSLPEPPSIAFKDCSGPQLEIVQVDSPLQEPLLGATESNSGPQLNNMQPDSLPELLSVTGEGSSAPQLNNSQADTPLAETSFLSPSFPTESSGGTNINNQEGVLLLGSYSLYTSLQSSGEPQVTNIQADTQLLEFFPVLFLPSENSTEPQPEHIQPIALSSESSLVSSSLLTPISSEPHPKGTLTDIPLMGFSPASSSPPTENSSESQPSNIQGDIQLTECLPISSSISIESPAEHKLKNIQPDIELGKFSPPSTESSTESQLAKTDFLEPELLSSIFTIMCFPESQLNNNKRDAQSPESTAASYVSSTENSPESHAIEVQTDDLVEESSFYPFYVPTNVSSEPQLNNMEADIPPQEPPHAPRTETQPNNVQTDLLLKRASFIEGFSPITIDCSTDALPHKGKEDIPLIVTLPGSSHPSTENTSDSQPSNNNENGNQLFSISTSSAEESLPNATQTEEPLTESSLVSTCPTNNTSNSEGKPNISQSGVPSHEISLLPNPLLEVFHNQALDHCLPTDRLPEFPLRSSSSLCQTVFAEKVILVEDSHPGSPPVNGNLIALESVSIDDPGELEVKSAGKVLHNLPVLDVQSSNNVLVDEDPASDTKFIPSSKQLLLKQLNSNSSEAFL